MSGLCAIACYFNPQGYERRRQNYHHFRKHLSVPLVTVELGFSGRFDLAGHDADILVQIPGRDVMWQKECLLNIAARHVPTEYDAIAWLDCDVVFEREDWPDIAVRALETHQLVQLFSQAYYMGRIWAPGVDAEAHAERVVVGHGLAQLVEGGKVDSEFVSPFARDRATVGRATAELSRDLSVFERTAEKAFVAGRYLPTRELYQMILEQNPGHTSALCKLGVVHLKLEDPVAAVDSFRRAVELDDGNPYACRMLGFSMMALGDYQNAEAVVKRALELAPSDARSHMLLATICYRLGRSGEAESYFKSAIDADPLPSEPYFNLALLCARDDRLEDARRYYQSALERGALPDTALEQTLAEQP